MQLGFRYFRSLSEGRTAIGRALLWLAAIILVLQFISSTHHDHGIDDNDADCVSCHLAAHFSSAAPASGMAMLPVPLLFAMLMAVLLPLYRFIATQSYLTPLPHAPPQRHSFQQGLA